MMKAKKRLFFGLGFLAFVSIGLFLGFRCYLEKSIEASQICLEDRASKALQYAQRHGLNTDYALFIDYSIPSGTPRLFVWDYNKKKVVARTYVMHGIGGGSTMSDPVFSNKPGSQCSSLGRFEVTKKHGNKLKRSFRLKGLDRSCSNAYRRGIMIHRSTWVDRWCWKEYIPLHGNSCQGCITVSSKGMNYLEKLINSQSKPLLLWSYV